MGKRRNGTGLQHDIVKKMRKVSLAELAVETKSKVIALSRFETLPAEMRVEIYRAMLPQGPIRLDESGDLSRPDFFTSHLQLTSFPHAGLQEEYLHEYFARTTFTVQKQHNIRNMRLETGLVLLQEANVQRIHMLSVELDDKLTVVLAFRGSAG